MQKQHFTCQFSVALEQTTVMQFSKFIGLRLRPQDFIESLKYESKDTTTSGAKIEQSEGTYKEIDNDFKLENDVESQLCNKVKRPEDKAASETLEDLKNLVGELRCIRIDPELEINRLLGELKTKINLKREQEKQKIDDEALVLVDELDEYERTCKSSLNDEQLTSSTELQELTDFCVKLNEQLMKINENLKKDLFGDQLADLELKEKNFRNPNIEPLL